MRAKAYSGKRPSAGLSRIFEEPGAPVAVFLAQGVYCGLTEPVAKARAALALAATALLLTTVRPAAVTS